MDAETAPFDLKKQLYLEENLSAANKKLEELKANRTDEEVSQINDLQAEVQTIKKEMTGLTKKEVVSKLVRFWAKSRKVGIDVLKEVFINVTAEIFKQLLTRN